MTPQEAHQVYGATHYIPCSDGRPQLYYKKESILFSTQEDKELWQYLSYCDSWQFSEINKEREGGENLTPIVPDWDLKYSTYKEGDCTPTQGLFGTYEVRTKCGKWRNVLTGGAFSAISYLKEIGLVAQEDEATSIKLVESFSSRVRRNMRANV